MTDAIFIRRAAQKALSRIGKPDQDRIVAEIRRLASEPRPIGVKKLSGRDAWRLRVGDYRIIYEIHDDQLVVLVVAMGRRREAYR